LTFASAVKCGEIDLPAPSMAIPPPTNPAHRTWVVGGNIGGSMGGR